MLYDMRADRFPMDDSSFIRRLQMNKGSLEIILVSFFQEQGREENALYVIVGPNDR